MTQHVINPGQNCCAARSLDIMIWWLLFPNYQYLLGQVVPLE